MHVERGLMDIIYNMEKKAVRVIAFLNSHK